MIYPIFAALALACTCLAAAETSCDANAPSGAPDIVERRSLNEIYEAAQAQGGQLTLWHGGDEQSLEPLVTEFKKAFPKINLNWTVDLSKYHDGRIDDQIEANNVYVDSVILQTLHDYPRWAKKGELLKYAPLGFDQVYDEFKSPDAAYYGIELFSWANIWNTDKLPNADFSTFKEFTKPEYKNKLVLTYPNDDDAVLWAFDLVIEKLGRQWFDDLLKNEPRWVRGSRTPFTLLNSTDASDQVAVTFTTSSRSFDPPQGIKSVAPTDANFVSWPQTAAILKRAPNPESAKLLHSWMLTPEFQKLIGWSVRKDVEAPEGFRKIMDTPNTDPTAFAPWMADRDNVERRKLWYESALGTAQGLSPLVDEL